MPDNPIIWTPGGLKEFDYHAIRDRGLCEGWREATAGEAEMFHKLKAADARIAALEAENRAMKKALGKARKAVSEVENPNQQQVTTLLAEIDSALNIPGDVVDRLNQLEILEENWDSYEAARMQKGLRPAADLILAALHQADIQGFTTLNSQGQIVVEGSLCGAEFEVTVFSLDDAKLNIEEGLDDSVMSRVAYLKEVAPDDGIEWSSASEADCLEFLSAGPICETPKLSLTNGGHLYASWRNGPYLLGLEFRGGGLIHYVCFHPKPDGDVDRAAGATDLQQVRLAGYLRLLPFSAQEPYNKPTGMTQAEVTTKFNGGGDARITVLEAENRELREALEPLPEDGTDDLSEAEWQAIEPYITLLKHTTDHLTAKDRALAKTILQSKQHSGPLGMIESGIVLGRVLARARAALKEGT